MKLSGNLVLDAGEKLGIWIGEFLNMGDNKQKLVLMVIGFPIIIFLFLIWWFML